MPTWAMKILGGVGVLAFAVVALILFGNSRHHSGVIEERMAWQNKDFATKLAATEKVGRTEKAQAVETQRSSDAIETARLAGRADALRYVAGLHQSTGVHVDLPNLTGAASGIAGAGETTQLDGDTIICADNTVIAEAWLDWYKAEAAIHRP